MLMSTFRLRFASDVAREESTVRKRKLTKAEQKLLSRAGEWVIRDGKFYDPLLRVWILKCEECKVTYGARRRHSKTCSKAHQKARQRRLAAGLARTAHAPLFNPPQAV